MGLEGLRLAAAVFILGLVAGVGIQDYAANTACPTPHCADSSRITPVVDRQYFQTAHEILSDAKESIHIASFELKYYEDFPDSQMNRLIEELVAAKRRGVKVMIVVDQYSKENNAYHILDREGIEWKFDSEKTTTHSKLIIVDGETVLVGSTNLSYYGLEKNHEANVLIRNRETAEIFVKYFHSLWDGG